MYFSVIDEPISKAIILKAYTVIKEEVIEIKEGKVR